MAKSEYHRIHMRSGDGDHVTAYLPLAAGRFEKGGPQPFLLKALWVGDDYYGELKPEGSKLNRIVWDSGPDSLTDFGTVPVKPGALVRVYEDDTTDAEFREFVIHDLSRV